MTRARAIFLRGGDAGADMAESRLSRWSRLKQKGGADTREETSIEEARTAEKQAVDEADSAALKLPGGARVRHFVPAMAPLAPDPEDEDDRLTRGIGHSDDGGEPDVSALENGPDDVFGDEPDEAAEADENDDLYAGIEDEELTPEQEELVASLPPLDSLTQDSDFTPFMQEGVPEFLKRKAMRILWRSNPLFGFRDGLNDYDEDFNVVHKIIKEGFGAYQVGRGHLSEDELQNMMPERAKRAFDVDEEDDESESDSEVAEIPESADTEPSATTAPDTVSSENPGAPENADADTADANPDDQSMVKKTDTDDSDAS